MTYAEKLKDPRWLKFRRHILSLNDHKCQMCGDGDRVLQAHHGYYETGLDPWNYSIDTVWCLCRECHDNIGYDMRNIHKMIAMVNPAHLKLAAKYIRQFQIENENLESPYLIEQEDNG